MFFGALLTGILQVLKCWAKEKRTLTFYMLINECFHAIFFFFFTLSVVNAVFTVWPV